MNSLRSLVRLSFALVFACVAPMVGATDSAVFHVDTRNLTLYTNTVGGVRWTYCKTGSDATIYNMGFAAGVSSLTTVQIPAELGGASVRSIDYRAFRGQRVQKLILPDTVTSICRGAFADATSLTGVYCLGDKPTFDAKALEGATANLAFFVRAGRNGWTDADGTLPATLTMGDGSTRSLKYCWSLAFAATANGSISGAAAELYADGATISLTGKPASGYIFCNWTGDLGGCTLVNNTATVPMTADRTIGATFTEDVYPPTLVAGEGETRLEWNLVVGEEGDAAYVVSSPYHGSQSGLQMTLIGCPTNCLISNTLPTTIAADSSTMLTFRAKALAASPSSDWETFTIRVTTAEGATIDIPAAFHAAAERAALTTAETKLVSTMTLGEHTEVSFTLVNDTGVETGKIHLDYTPYSWLSLVGPKTLPSLGAGESRTVTLALDPSLDCDWNMSEAYCGNVIFTCEQGTGGSINFAFTPVTDSTGSIRVVCKDNSGEGATYVPLAGASISLLKADSLTEVATGTSDADGVCTLVDLPVGRYVIGVTAADHDTRKAVVYVRAGVEAEVRALLSVAIVTGRAEFKWIEIEDEYVLVYTPQIVHVVPAPDVEWTVSPRVLAEGGTTIVQMHVKNVGLVRATSVTFAFPAYPAASHHISFSANGFSLDPNEERDVTVRFVCDDADCKGTGTSRTGYATMKVGYTSSDPETGEVKNVGYCDGKAVLHGNVPEPTYEMPELVFTEPDSDDSGDKRTYDPDYELLNSDRVVFKTGEFEATETVQWPMISRPDAVVPVTLEIQQTASLKRDVIEGSFVFSNKSETAEAHIHLDIKIQNEAGEDCRHLFTIVATNTVTDGCVPLDGTRLRDGEVSLAALLEGRAGYWFVPTRDAAPTNSVDYYFGGSFIYRIGADGSPQTNDLMFCKMTVSPMPYLKMDYFTQRDVFSDNPFTDVTEAYQPAEFALRVRNEGGGAAKNVRISSSRPSIITNESNLVVDYDLRNWSYASYLDGTSTTLDLDTVNLGTIAPGATTVAEWLFVSTLEGHFTTNGHARLEYKMPWQNSETTQISEDIGVHLLVHRCQADEDGVVDFLTSEKSTGAPDQLWCSASADPVAVSTNATAEIVGDGALSGASATLTVRVTAAEPGPVYVSSVLEDAKTYRVSALRLEGGAELPADNAWTTDRTFVPVDLTTAFGSRPIREGRIHIFDIFETAGTRTYTITLEPRFAYVVGDEEGGYRVGETYTLTVPTETTERTMQRLCCGWKAFCNGVETASGVANEVSFALTETGPYETTLDWSTNYWVSATNSANGSVRLAEGATTEGWFAAGTNVVIEAVPETGYGLTAWTGDTEGCTVAAATLTAPINCARNISANFAILSQTVRIGDAGHSATIPAAGNLTYDYWSTVTVEVAQVHQNCGATQYVCKGWTTTNAEPSSGEGVQAVFTVRGDVDLDWIWQTNVVTLADAINASNLEFTAGGARAWRPEWNEDSSDGDHNVVIDAIGNNTNAWIETTVEGAGSVSFVWKSALAGRNTKLQFYIDGEAKGLLQYTNEWTTVEETVCGKGTHVLRWRLFTGRSGASARDSGALDALVWTPAVPPTLAEALNEKLVWTTDGDALWEGVARDSQEETRETWAVITDLGDDESATLETRVYGAGTLTFDWAVSCEAEYDNLEVSVDGTVKADISGEVDWTGGALKIVGEGWHTVRWTFVKDEIDDAAYTGTNVAWLDNVAWAWNDGVPPSIDDDPDATVSGTGKEGFVIRPSTNRTSVVVSIPEDTDAGKVTVEIGVNVEKVTANGAAIRMFRDHNGTRHDITEYLDIPASDAAGIVDLTQVRVRDEVVKDALDTTRSSDPAVISLDPASPGIQTAPTKPGLIYTFSEGTTLNDLIPKAEKMGDGTVWSPTISVKGGTSGFFKLGIRK